MTLAPGTRLGVYEVLAAIGKGGMGEVWKARDTRLGREVALKTLPGEFAADPDRLARFEREAKLLASLNHPNIGTIYGFEEVKRLRPHRAEDEQIRGPVSASVRAGDGAPAPKEDGDTRFLVLELVEGETLADRLTRGAIPVEEALKLALQIAEALEAAHEKGVIHRDLKPANVMITTGPPEGRVKVLDFGLAKAFSSGPADLHVSQTPTVSVAATEQGLILGTPGYMSPEQAQGKPVDRQTDIWAFGATVFEMVTGHPPFLGETRAETLAFVQTKEPDWEAVPARLRRLLRWCLQKDQRRRLRDIRDGLALLDEPETSPGDIPAPPHAWRSVAVAAVVVALLAIAWGLSRSGGDAGARRVAYVDLAMPAGTALAVPGTAPNLAVSPDGTRVAFIGETDGVASIWLRSLDAPLGRRLVGTEGTLDVFWAPDGRNLGFHVPDALRRIDVETGVIRDIASVGVLRGASWGTRGTIVYGRLPGGLLAVDANGGPSVPVTEVSGEERFHYYPSFLPDGERFLYATETGIWVGSTENAPRQSDRVHVLETAINATYVSTPDGDSVIPFTNGRTLYAERFDPEALSVVGSPVAIVEGIGSGNLQQFGSYSASATGLLLTPPLEDAPSYRLVRVSASGDRVGEAGSSRRYLSLMPSPDGSRTAALATTTGFADLGVLELDRGSWTTVATNGIYPNFAWSPDGTEIAYTSLRDSPRVYRVRATGQREELFGSDTDERYVWDWTEAGLLYSRRRSDAQHDIELLELGGGSTRPLVADGYYNYGAQRSPDGRWMTFVSNASGRDQVYLQSFAQPNGRRESVSVDGGTMPAWNADGSAVYFQSPGGRLMAVEVASSDDGVVLGRPESLFDLATTTFNYPGARTWAYRPNQDEFLVVRSATFSTRSVRLTLDWPDLLTQDEED